MSTEPENLSEGNSREAGEAKPNSGWKRLWRVAEFIIALMLFFMLLELGLIWTNTPEGELPEVRLFTPPPPPASAPPEPPPMLAAKPAPGDLLAKMAPGGPQAHQPPGPGGGLPGTPHTPSAGLPPATGGRSAPPPLFRFENVRRALSDVMISGSGSLSSSDVPEPPPSIPPSGVVSASMATTGQVARTVVDLPNPNSTNRTTGIRIGLPE